MERQLAATDIGPGLSLFSKQSKVMVWRPNLTMTQAQPNLTRSVRRLDQGGTGPRPSYSFFFCVAVCAVRRLGQGRNHPNPPLLPFSARHLPPETLDLPRPMDPQQPEPVSYLCGGN